eukprot:TRINITY_DN5080_c0_g1_i3.p2 TRINITY_DN5080_c0_g1~~TRINITY_DN5080_c0_g1_i3.p2  ORF type:complete len:303 (-),score=113.91 TRINITY_DN5080_c0_g1_i3:683-1591(-)
MIRALSTGSARPLRSVLYTPGFGKHLAKVKTSVADCALIDLEDGVAPSSKVAARKAVAELFQAGGLSNRMLTVRVNGLDTEWGWDDLKAVAKLERVDAIALPKVESPAEVQEVAAYLEKEGASQHTTIWSLIETPKGVQNVDAIAAAHPRQSALVMGTSDLCRELHCLHTKDREPLLYSLSKCVVAARANDLLILDGVHLDLEDSTGFEQACKQGKELGMDGKTLIHPSTVAVANWFFGPSAEDVEQSYRIVEAMQEAMARGQGACLLDGKLIENLHADNALRIIALHEAIQAFEESAAASK